MTIYAASTGFIQIGEYRLNVTSRAASFAGTENMMPITRDTIKLWVFCAGKIQAGINANDLTDEVAGMIVEEKYGIPAADEPHCTVWGDVFPGQSLTVHSTSILRVVFDLWYARESAIIAAIEALGLPTPPAQQPAPQNTPEPRHKAEFGDLPPSAVPTPTEGVIDAQGFPSARNMQYANGQLVRFSIERIAVNTAGGKPVYELFMPGGKYAAFKVYSDNEIAMHAIGETLRGLGLSFDKPEVTGNWQLVAKTANREKGGAPIQYFNPQYFEA